MLVCMRVVSLRQLLIVLTSLAFLIGIGAQAMLSAWLTALSRASAEHTVMGESCATMTTQANAGHAAPIKQEPCKRISQFGCICSPALPAPSTPLASPIAWRLMSYWPRLASALAEISIKPDLHPPIAA
jgi:hypothetical protein